MDKLKQIKVNKKIFILIIPIFIIFFTLFLLIIPRTRPQEIKDKLTKITFQSENLPTIETGHYALWGIDSESKRILIKRFTFNSGFFSLDGSKLLSLNVKDHLQYQKYEVSIEKVGDLNENQSECVLFSGDVVENKVNFTVPYFKDSNLTAKFTLGTPTDNTKETNETSGLWFTTSIDGVNTKNALSLIKFEKCFIWAAYLEYRGQYLRIGRFSDFDKSDDFKDFSFASTNTPSIPGEDFLRELPQGLNAPIKLPLKDNKVILSIEPKQTDFRLYIDHRPYLEIMNYIFGGEEEPLQVYNLNGLKLPEMTITLENIN